MLQPRVIISLVLFSVVLYSCEKPGCTHPESFNYDPDANLEDGSCVPKVFGCLDTASTNYNSNANTDDGSCIPKVYGCTNPDALNYNPDANVDDGSCDCNREMFYGTYNVTSICSHYSTAFTPDTTYYTIEIFDAYIDPCRVSIFNFFNSNTTPIYSVSGNAILKPTYRSCDDTYGLCQEDSTSITLSNDTLYIHTITTVFPSPGVIERCDKIGIKQ
jgi:hypothetical protein